MTDTQQPNHPARPAPQAGGQPLPQRQNGPQTVRVPVTSLVNPQPRKPISKGVPPEETPEEPWQEDEFDPDENQDDQVPPPKASAPLPLSTRTPGSPAGLPAVRRPEGAPGEAAPPSERSERSEPVQLPRRTAFTRPGEHSEPRTERPAATPAVRPAFPVRQRADTTPSPDSRPTSPTTSGSGRPALLPRMELKPVLPVDPERSGINVVPVPPRVLAPPPPSREQSSTDSLPEIPAPVRFSPSNLTRSPVRSAPSLGSTPDSASTAAPAPETPPAPTIASIRASAQASPAPDLSTLLEHLVNLPDQTAILGVCDDRLPVLLDLGDPTPGALLVASDDETLRTRLLRTLLQTSAALNSPRSVQFLILSSQPAEWQNWLDGLDAVRHCLGVDSLVEGSPSRWLLKLAGWADQRRTGSSSGPAVILVVDDLALVPQLEYDARVNFDWLVKEGPGVRIWPVVGVAVERAPELSRWVRLFKTRILGPAQDASLYRLLAALDEQESSTLLEAAQFAVRIQENWLKFRVPALPGEKD